MTYRILIARSGYYYVQRQKFSGWEKVGGFFNTRRGAESFIRDIRKGFSTSAVPRVVGYY